VRYSALMKEWQFRGGGGHLDGESCRRMMVGERKGQWGRGEHHAPNQGGLPERRKTHRKREYS